jgi:hypothetical protein
MIAVCLSSCGRSQVDNQLGGAGILSITAIPTPPGDYGRLAWIDDWILLEISPFTEPTAFSSRIWRFHPDGSQTEQLAIPDLPRCHRQGFNSPARLPDNRLGYLVYCFPLADSALADIQMMAYDLHTDIISALLPYALPSQQVGTGGYSWNPTMTRGITSDGNGRGLSEQLYWLNPTRPESFDVQHPQAFAATWAPDGTQIAFLGAPEQGLTGVARADAFFNLYLMQPDGSQIRSVIEQLHSVASMAWSPNSRWIVLPASLTSQRNDKGLLLVEAATGTYRQIAQGDFAAPAWSPDGHKLAVLQYHGEYPQVTVQMVIIELDPLLAVP